MKHFQVLALCLLIAACKGNTSNTAEQPTDSIATNSAEHKKTDNTALLGDHKPTIKLPDIGQAGPIDHIWDDDELVGIANLGMFSSLETLKASPFYPFMESSFPALKDIDKLDIDQGEGDIYLLLARDPSGNTTLAINQLNYKEDADETLENVDVLLRTDSFKAVLIRAKLDNYPHYLHITCTHPEFGQTAWRTVLGYNQEPFGPHKGVAWLSANPIDTSILMGNIYTAQINGKEKTIRFFSDHRMYIGQCLCTYQSFFTSDLSRRGFYFYGGSKELEGVAYVNGYSPHGFDFELTPAEGFDFGIGLGNTVIFSTEITTE